MVGAVLLAAGESTRMGQLKALLPWHGQSLLAYCLTELAAASLQPVICVLGHSAHQLEPIAQPTGAAIVLNARYREGRATSIATGVAALPLEAAHVVIASVDQPRSRGTVARLVAAHQAGGHAISRAVHRGIHGHPTVFARSLVPELRAVAETSEGLKSVLRAHVDQINDVEIDDPDVLLNLNTFEQYQAAVSYHGRRPC
jgi:molybdenum cofactor cytidylyltransferase